MSPCRKKAASIAAPKALGAAAVLLALAGAPLQAAEAPKVVASIKPLHSLVAGVMQGIGEPTLLMPGGSSPHAFALRPSQARDLSEADLVFWVGPEIEGFLVKPLKALPRPAAVVELSKAPGIALLPARSGGAWEGHDHDHHGHEGHDDHGLDEHGQEKSAGHGEKDEHGEHDLHVWLDPQNGKQIVAAVVAALAERNPENAALYQANAVTMTANLDALDAELTTALRPVRGLPYVVFHDAYQYFESRYGTNAVGSITVSPERAPGAKRLYEIRKKILTTKAGCVFSEPQFEPTLVETVVKGTSAKTAVLDPLGADISAGPKAYGQLLRGLSDALIGCLKPVS